LDQASSSAAKRSAAWRRAVDPIAVRLPLKEIAQAHELVERGAGGRVVPEL
jgi:hypothetical protein